MRHAAAALVEWASAARKAKNWAALQRVAFSLLKVLQGSPGSESDVAVPASGTPCLLLVCAACRHLFRVPASRARLPKGAGGTTPAPKSVVQTRIIVPTLRTLHHLLSQGCFDDLQLPRSEFAAQLVRLTRLRCMKVCRCLCWGKRCAPTFVS
jgi:hypothetical protein